MSGDFFQTDFSFLGQVEQVTTPKTTNSNLGSKAMVRSFAGVSYQVAHSAETRAKMSASQKGKTHSADTCAKISAAQKGRPGNRKGITLSAETRAKISASMKGKTHSADTRAKWSDAHTGKTLSAETRAKISAGLKGRKGWNEGKTLSAEHRAKIIAAKAKPIITPYGLFPSVRAVAEASGKPIYTVQSWVKKYPEHYYYVKDSK